MGANQGEPMKSSLSECVVAVFAAVAVALLAGCGGGAEVAATSSSPVLLVDGWVQPDTADQGVSNVSKRTALVTLPQPARVSLGPLADAKMAQAAGGIGPRQVGLVREVEATQAAAKTLQHLQWKTSSSGGLVAAISFAAEGAHGLRLGVVARQLPPGAVFRFYRQTEPGSVFQISGQDVLQSIQRNAQAGETGVDAHTWWSPDLGFDEVTLEIEVPAGTQVGTLDFSVPRISHIYENLAIPTEEEFSAKINESASCHLDASCQEAYANQRNAVARMIYTSGGSTYVCTGTLLNDNQSSGTPYFLTANHCISTQAEASSLQTDWFYRAPTCNSRTLSSATTKRFNGAALLYTTTATDITLLRLNDTPPAGVFFAGWDASAQSIGTPVVGLHHPRGDLLKMSIGDVNSYSSCSATSGTQFQCSGTTGNFYRVIWNQGTTEGGSSGSAIFKGGTHVIGTLYGGSASCSAISAPEFYGRFDIAYNDGLKNWLAAGTSAQARTAIYRFFNIQTGAHFFTSSAAERDYVIATYPQFQYENIAFYAYAQPTAGQSAVYRFFNLSNSAHFYTISQGESDFVRANYPVYKYEGPIWYAQATAGNAAIPVYRFYKPGKGTHFYTVNAAERDYVIANYRDFSYEGVAYHAWNSR